MRSEIDISYGSDAAQRLDLFAPLGSGFATVVFVHGGSLTRGDKSDRDYKDVCTRFPAAGVACANINYRLGPSHKWPSQGDDVAAAVAWVKKNIASRGGEPKKIFLFGHSSGATLVALIGADEQYLNKFGMKLNDVRGVVPMGSIMWDDELDKAIQRVGREKVGERFSQQSDYSIFGGLDAYLNYWPFRHVRSSMPPYLFLIAESEQMNPPILMTNRSFVERSRELGNVAEYRVLPDRTHDSAIRKFSEKDDPTFILVRDFISRY